MNFDEAVQAHAQWKAKLSDYLNKPDGSLKVADIQLDNKCKLGQWIYSDGTKYAALPEYTTLKTEHARFHKCAAEVVKKADAGQKMQEEVALGANSDFAKTSSTVVLAIMNMKKKASA